MAVRRGVNGADRLIALYNILLAVVWASLGTSSPAAAPAAVAHGTAALIPWLLWSRPDTELHQVGASTGAGRSRRGRDAVRMLYPLVALSVFWVELGPLIEAVGRTPIDTWVLGLDQRVFGIHLHAVWSTRMDNAFVDEMMHLSYVAYYPLIFVPPVIAFARGRVEAVQDMMFRLMLSYLLCYAMYLWAPTYGVRYTTPSIVTADGGFFRGLAEWAHAAGDSKGTAFPSSHVVGAVTIAILGWRWFGRVTSWLLTIEAGGVVLATVYTQNHYAIDSLVGLISVLVLQLLIVPFVFARASAARAAPPSPVLPRFDRLLRPRPAPPVTNPSGVLSTMGTAGGA